MILEETSTRLALSIAFLLKLSETASHRYKEYTIAKRTGGQRTIHHPARELKLVQNSLLRNVLMRLPVHTAATAYSKGSSIKRNAEMHVANNYLLRVDFQDFFPSLTGRDVIDLLENNRQKLSETTVTDQDLNFIKQIVCRYDALTIGAPTSPQLSNAIMFEFDGIWAQRSQALEVTYTRYADDLYFSTDRPNVLEGILDSIRRYLFETHAPTLRINDKKTAFSSRKRRRLVAGLVLTSDRKISIGRGKKRLLKSLVNKLKHNELPADQFSHLMGWIAYLRSVEPVFVLALQKKYNLDFDASTTWKV